MTFKSSLPTREVLATKSRGWGWRNKNQVKRITLHHCAGFKQSSINTLAYEENGASASLLVDDFEMVIINPPSVRFAYSDANNPSSIATVGIEMVNSAVGDKSGWPVSEKTIDNTVILCAEISLHYGLGTLVYGKNIFTHTQVSQLGTSCPGPFVLKRVNEIIRRANDLIRAGGVKQVERTSTTLWQGRVTANGGLNVRSGPGTNYNKIDAFAKGQVVNVEEEKDNWLRVSQQYQTWVSADFVKRIEEKKTYLVKVTGNGVNVRTEPWGRVVGAVYANEVFTVVDDSNKDFYKLKSGTYISKLYAKPM